MNEITLADTIHPIYCENCDELICNTFDTELEMRLMTNHIYECKKKPVEVLHT